MFKAIQNFFERMCGHPTPEIAVPAMMLGLGDGPYPIPTAELPPPSHLGSAPKGKRWCLGLKGEWELVKIIPADIDPNFAGHRWPSLNRKASLKKIRKRGKKPAAHGTASRKSKRRSKKSRKTATKSRRHNHGF